MDYFGDIATIKEAGFDKYLNKTKYGQDVEIQHTATSDLAGGELPKNGVISLGNGLFKINGKLINQTCSDGATERILIGKRPDGTFGVDVSTSGFDVNTAYRAEMDLSSQTYSDWLAMDPAEVIFYDGYTFTTTNDTGYYFNALQYGDRVKLQFGVGTAYFYGVVLGKFAGKIAVLGYDYQNNVPYMPNATTTKAYYSRLIKPSNFPISFSDAGVTVYQTDHTLVSNTETETMSIKGDQVVADYNLSFNTVNTQAVYGLSSFLENTTGVGSFTITPVVVNVRCVNNGAIIDCVIGPGSGYGTFDISKLDGSNFATGAFTAKFQLIFNYEFSV